MSIIKLLHRYISKHISKVLGKFFIKSLTIPVKELIFNKKMNSLTRQMFLRVLTTLQEHIFERTVVNTSQFILWESFTFMTYFSLSFCQESSLPHIWLLLTTCSFFLSRFSFTNIHDSQGNRGRGRLSL